MPHKTTGKRNSHHGFTLAELMVVVTLVGILASVATVRYIAAVEKGRTAEAKNILGLIRDAEKSYNLEYNVNTGNLSALGISVPIACNASFYYSYGLSMAAGVWKATAIRCTANGKPPQYPTAAYNFTINDANLTCSDVRYL